MRTTTSIPTVTSVAADEGMLWALRDGRPGLLGSAAVSVFEPITPADSLTADLSLWVDTTEDAAERWSALLDGVLSALRVVGIDRVVTTSGAADADRIRALVAAGFRIRAVDHDRLRLEVDGL